MKQYRFSDEEWDGGRWKNEDGGEKINEVGKIIKEDFGVWKSHHVKNTGSCCLKNAYRTDGSRQNQEKKIVNMK